METLQLIIAYAGAFIGGQLMHPLFHWFTDSDAIEAEGGKLNFRQFVERHDQKWIFGLGSSIFFITWVPYVYDNIEWLVTNMGMWGPQHAAFISVFGATLFEVGLRMGKKKIKNVAKKFTDETNTDTTPS